jgi:hypothetical protein
VTCDARNPVDARKDRREISRTAAGKNAHRVEVGGLRDSVHATTRDTGDTRAVSVAIGAVTTEGVEGEVSAASELGVRVANAAIHDVNVDAGARGPYAKAPLSGMLCWSTRSSAQPIPVSDPSWCT